MTILFIRTIILYALVIAALRLMGKRQIGQLQPSELVVAIMISDIASIPISDVSVPILYGIIPIFTLVLSEILLSLICLKSQKVRMFMSGRPQILVRNGKICFEEMKKSRVNTDDLLEELRKSGYFSLSDIDTVILETGGTISVIPKSDATPPTLKDFKIDGVQTKIPFVYVADGKVRKSELKRGGKSETWLLKFLNDKKIKDVKSVLIMSQDSEGNIFLQERKDKK